MLYHLSTSIRCICPFAMQSNLSSLTIIVPSLLSFVTTRCQRRQSTDLKEEVYKENEKAEIAGLENAGLENDGLNRKGEQCIG